jgi:heme/copper-type cytochrome/quinol oxidase subunit 4
MSAHEKAVSFDDRAPPSLKNFGLTFAVIFALIGFWPLVRHGADPRYWSLIIAALFLAITFVAPQILSPLNKLWFAFGMLLHKIVNPLILGFLFIVLLTPIALVLRVLGKKLVATEFDKTASSYWINRDPPGPEPSSIKNQF